MEGGREGGRLMRGIEGARRKEDRGQIRENQEKKRSE
jgi:hypothetical protein